MTELTRLLDSSEDELELALLRSALDEAPSDAALRDTALALGLTATTATALAESLVAAGAVGHVTAQTAQTTAASGALGTTGGAGAAASFGSASFATLAKYLAAGALVSFGTVATVDHVLTPSAPSAPPAAPAKALKGRTAEGPAVAPSRPAASPATPSVVEPEPEPEPTAATEGALVPRKASASKAEPAPASEPGGRTEPPQASPLAAPPPARAAFTPVAPATAPASHASLAAEIRLLDRTRDALAAGDTASARGLLQRYVDSRPSGVLTHEANLLRVRLLLAEGDRRAASALARQIIAQHPGSNHVDSLRRLAAEP